MWDLDFNGDFSEVINKQIQRQSEHIRNLYAGDIDIEELFNQPWEIHGFLFFGDNLTFILKCDITQLVASLNLTTGGELINAVFTAE